MDKVGEMPFLYYRTKEEIETYLKMSTKLKLQWLEAQMEFFYKAMPPKAKAIREKFFMTNPSPSNDQNAPHPVPPPRGGRVREGVTKLFPRQLQKPGLTSLSGEILKERKRSKR